MIYVDSSALVKWVEPGTDKVLTLLNSEEEVGSSILTLAEIESAFGRLFREGRLDKDQLSRQRAHLAEGWEAMKIVDLDEKVIAELRKLVLRLPLQTGDAVHLASALLIAPVAKELLFCSADASLLRSASAEGLETWSPLAPS